MEPEKSKKNLFSVSTDYNERVENLMGDLRLKDFFKEKTADRKMTFDSYTIHRFLIYSRIMEPLSKYAVPGRLDSYYEKPDFGCQHILQFMHLLE